MSGFFLTKRTFNVHYIYTDIKFNSRVKGIKIVEIKVNSLQDFDQERLDALVVKNFKKVYRREVTILKIEENSGFGTLEMF